ncbi:MAG: riboflavin synthase [Kiloniellales bacterium]|nr:riboflavin synthase [Kiloniellales bacterium]
MFTGIVTDLGRLRAIRPGGDTRLVIETAYDTAGIEIGASIACSGTCLTVVETGPGCFAVDVSAETLSRTTLGAWQPGDPVNLERALRLGDELGGHLVSGHVDATAEILERRPEGDSQRFVFRAPAEVAPFIAAKGSVALDGVSLTVNEVEDEPGEGVRFGVNIIPHTAENTSFGAAQPGQRVNLEIDMLARYLQRQLGRQD